MTTGIIFSIEEFAINDGPGIRTAVFLKGCPLRCAWCHNPEGMSFKPQTITRQGIPEICGTQVTAKELAAKLLKDTDLYKLNEGGVTITGGEPLAQPGFVIRLLEFLEPVHTAMETSGHAPSEIFERAVSLVDLLLFDIKHTDPETHRFYTGVNNSLILDNLRHLMASGKDFVVRVPLIPGVNDTQENMQNILELIREAPSLQRVELLRYHKTAGAKYSMTGKTYDPPFDPEAEVSIHNVFEDHHIKTLIL